MDRYRAIGAVALDKAGTVMAVVDIATGRGAARMSMVRLYPIAFRQRWGDELEAELRAAGWRAWPGLLVGILDMWLHPALWPAESRELRRTRVAAMAIAVTVAGWLVAHLITEQGSAGYARVLDGCALGVVVGLGLAAPRPRLSWRTFAAVWRHAVRRLGAPVILGAAVLLVVHIGLADRASLPVRVVVLTGWWTTWALGVVQGCRILVHLEPELFVPPRPVRSQWGVGVLAATTAVAAATTLVFATASAHSPGLATVAGFGLLGSTAVVAAALHDLRHVPVGE